MNILKKLIAVAVIVVIAIPCNAQFLKIKEGVSFIDQPLESVNESLNTKEYFYKNADGEFKTYVKHTSMGDAYLTISIKGNKVTGVSWENHVINASRLRADAKSETGFVMEQQKYSTIISFKNIDKNLRITIMTPPGRNITSVTIGKLK